MKKNLIIVSFLLVAGTFLPVSSVLAAQECTPFSHQYTSGTNVKIQGDGNAVPTYQSSLWTPVFPGATWIWSSQFVQNPEGGDTSTFVLDFTLPAAVASSTLEISADDYFVVAVNGTQVDSQYGEANFFPENIYTYHTPQLFQQGANTMTFKVVNAPYFYTGQGTTQNNPAGLLFRLGVEGTSCVNSSGDVVLSGGASSGGGGGTISGPLSYGYQAPVPTQYVPPVVAPAPSVTTQTNYSNYSDNTENRNKDTTGGIALGEVAGAAAINDGSEGSTTTTKATEGNSPLLAAVGSLSLPQSLTCFLKSFLLVLLMVLIWLGIARMVNPDRDAVKFRKTMLRREIMFYTIASILAVIAFRYFADQCGLISFLILAALLMVGRITQNAYSDR